MIIIKLVKLVIIIGTTVHPPWSRKPQRPREDGSPTANPRTNIVDFGGFDSSTILNLRGGIPRLVGDFPEF